MNANLFIKSLKEIRVSWTSYAIGLMFYVYLLISVYPSIQERAKDFQKIFENYPEGFLRFFSGGSGVADITSPEGFLSIEIFAFMWFVIIGAFVIAYGTGAIGKEIDSGTIEILLSQPITRTSAIISKGLTLFGGTAALVFITMASTYLFSLIVDLTIKPEGILALAAVGALFFLAVAAYSLFFSVLLSERGHAAFASAGILIAMYLLTSLKQYATWAEKLDVISLFHYYNSAQLLTTGDIPLKSTLVYAGTTIFFVAASILVFSRRDIAP
ncbi:MAG: ABC transporter permease subunit [Actinomycetota bacterium]|nr:ABC transporter permease subunit [Actinomycetota bacterium]